MEHPGDDPLASARAGAPTGPRVALFSTVFLAPNETFIYQQILAHRRYAVEVFADRRAHADAFPFDDVHVLRDAEAGFAPLATAESLLYRLTTLSPRFLRALRSGRFSLIHAHFGPAGIYAMRYAQRCGLPLVVLFHGYDVPLLMGPTPWGGAALRRPEHMRYTLLHKALFAQADRLLVASEDLRALLLSCGAPEEKVEVWRLGVRIPVLPPPAVRALGAPFRIAAAGAMVEKKGYDYLLRAVARVREAGVDARLALVGDGPRRDALERLASDLGLADAVQFRGFLPHGETLVELGAADVTVAPSVVAHDGDRDSGVMTLKEAGARFRPVVGTRHGGIPEIVDEGRTGYLVPERDPAALADRLLRLASEPAHAAALGAAGRARVEQHYRLEDRVAALEAIYDDVVARR